jgi:hypothetical protein
MMHAWIGAMLLETHCVALAGGREHHTSDALATKTS